MRPERRRGSGSWLYGLGTTTGLVGSVILSGCASPGPPRPPSLFLPRVANDIQATRRGDTVELRFSVPTLSTDGQPLRARVLHGVLCRQEGSGGPCRPADPVQTAQPLSVPGRGSSAPVIWTDTLPAALVSGKPRPIAYRIRLETPSGGNAGFSDPVYTAAGAAPPPVAALQVEGNRLGVELRWTPVAGAGEVLLRRVEQSPPDAPAPAASENSSPLPTGPRAVGKPGRGTHAPSSKRNVGATEPGLVWLQAEPGATAAAATLDNSIEPGATYRYTAIRRERVQVGGRTLELESEPSATVEMTWRDLYPPPAPTELTALGYTAPSADQGPAGYAVDLVWLPVEDKELAGYLVSRQSLAPNGAAIGPSLRLTPQPVAAPGFHDASAQPGQRYRYTVSAVATNGHESGAAETMVQPRETP